MLRRGLIFTSQIIKSHLKMNIIIPSRSFATYDDLKKVLKSEINHEETNYSPVDKNELKTFFQNTKFQFTEKENSLNLELSKTHDNYEIIVTFQAKPPVPNEQNPEEQSNDDKSI